MTTATGIDAPAGPKPPTPADPSPTLTTRVSTARVSAGRQWLLITQWQLRRHAQYLPLLIIVQTALAVCTVIGFGFLLPQVPHEMALAITTGAPTVTLIMVGLVMTPQMVAQAKTEGSQTWLHTLPVPRLMFLAADLTVWTLIALPGVVLAVLIGTWRYDLHLALAPWLIPAAVLISLTAASVGYAMASLLPPQLALLATQLLVFIIMFFSPMYFPASNLPSWLAAAHKVLPFQPAADMMRAGLDHVDFTVSGWQVAVLVIWCIGSVIVAAWSLRKRD